MACGPLGLLSALHGHHDHRVITMCQAGPGLCALGTTTMLEGRLPLVSYKKQAPQSSLGELESRAQCWCWTAWEGHTAGRLTRTRAAMKQWGF